MTHRISGKKDELIGKLQERYGITREQAQKEADEWAKATNAELDAETAGKYSAHAGYKS